MPAPLIFALARLMRWAIVGSDTRKARAISGVVRPPNRRKGERHLGGLRQGGMAAGEDEPEAVVLHGKLLV